MKTGTNDSVWAAWALPGSEFLRKATSDELMACFNRFEEPLCLGDKPHMSLTVGFVFTEYWLWQSTVQSLFCFP
jgi:hypothetical protein